MLTKEQINQARQSVGFQPIPAPGVTPPPPPKPLSERMGWTQSPEQAQSLKSDISSGEQYGSTFPYSTGDSPVKAGLKAIGNVPSSTVGLAKNIGSAVLHPIKTVSGIGEATMGGAQAALKGITGLDIGDEKAKSTFENLTNSLKERYGSLENLSRTATNDPSGFGLDILSLLGGGTSVAGLSSETENLLSKTGRLGAEPVAATGRIAKKLGEKSYSLIISPDIQEAEKILSYRAEHPLYERILGTVTGKEQPITSVRTATEQGLLGTKTMVGVKAKRQADSLWKNTIAPAVENSKAVVSQDELFSPIEKRISNTLEPAKRQAYMDAYEAIKDDYKSAPQFLSLKDAQNVKRGLDEFTPEKLFRGKNVANEYKVLQNDMANAIRAKTYDVIPTIDAKKAYLDYGNLIDLQKIGTKALTESGLQGGSGRLVGELYKSVVTPIATLGGQTLYKVGDFMEFIGKPGMKTLGDYLSTLGYATADAFLNDLGIQKAQVGNDNSNKDTSKPNSDSVKDNGVDVFNKI